MRSLFILLCSILFCQDILAQATNSIVATMERDIVYAQHDTTRLRLLIHLVDSIYDEKIWPRYNEQAFELGTKLSADKNQRISYIGKIYLADAMNNRGFLKNNQGDFMAAMDEYIKALSIREEVGYQRGIASSYNNIGGVFQNQGEFLRALEYYQKSLEIRERTGDRVGTAQSLSHIGEIYRYRKDYESALKYLQQSLGLYRIHGATTEARQVLQNLSDVYYLQGNFERSEDYLRQSLAYSVQVGDKRDILLTEIRLGRLRVTQGDLQTAMALAQKSLPIAEQYNFMQAKSDVYALLSEIFEKKGEFEASLKYFKRANEVRDSFINETVKRQSIGQQLQYEYGKKEAEQAAEQLRKDTNAKNVRNTLLASCLILFLFAGVLINRNIIRKLANEELEAKNQIIEQAKQRAEASERFKTQFLSNVSHEIRTPMNAILGMSDLLAKTAIDEQQKKYINAIHKSSENLLLIINDVLDFGKLEAGGVELENIPFVLEDTMMDVYNTLKFKAEEKGLEFRFVYDTKISPVLLGDGFRLYQVLMNLVGNAIKFTNKGWISLDAQLLEDKTDSQKIIYTVADSGIGIAPEKLTTIFESFRQGAQDTARIFGGTGLGLSIAQQLVGLRDSEIKVNSKIGEGTIFSFEVAYQKATTDALIQHSAQFSVVNMADYKGLRVLLVEDNEYNQIVAVETLMQHLEDCHIQVANNGQEALSLLNQYNYDVILMDISMPEMDGYEATQTIRTTYQGAKAHIPIIALTAFAFEETQKCLEIGMNACITKPFKVNQLFNEIFKFVSPNQLVKSSEKEAKTSATINEILDLRFIHEFTEGDNAQIEYFINKFLQKAPNEILKIQAALEAKDYEQLRKAAHSFKPQLEFVGIKDAFAQIKQLEADIAASKPHEGLTLDVAALVHTTDKGMTALQDWTTENKN